MKVVRSVEREVEVYHEEEQSGKTSSMGVTGAVDGARTGRGEHAQCAS